MGNALSLLDSGRNDRADEDKVGSLLIDLSELEISYSLLEDIRLYLGDTGLYLVIPRLFDLCVKTLKKTGRYYLTERDNESDLDEVYDLIDEMFDERKFRSAIKRHGLSVLQSTFRENVADYLYDIWELMYTEVGKYVEDKASNMSEVMGLSFQCTVTDLKTKTGNDGHGETIRETAIVLDVSSMLELSTSLLTPGNYND